MSAARSCDFRGSLALLCADALAFTPEITERHREIIVAALRKVAVGDVTEVEETAYFELMLHEGMQTTAAFNRERMEEVLRDAGF